MESFPRVSISGPMKPVETLAWAALTRNYVVSWRSPEFAIHKGLNSLRTGDFSEITAVSSSAPSKDYGLRKLNNFPLDVSSP